MSLTSSGEIKISQIQSELDYASNRVNASLKSLSDGSGALFGHTINTANASADRPDGSAPHAMTEFYSYDHDAGVSWSISGNTGLHCTGEAGMTDMADSFATITLSGGSGGVDVNNFTTSGGPFGNLKFQFTTDGSTPSSGTSGASTITQLESSLSSFNSGTLKLRPGWQHTPSNKDGTGSFSFTLVNNGANTAAITGNITFQSGGLGQGLCIHPSILVDTPNGMKNIYDLDDGDIIYSYNFETESIEEVPILDTLFVAHDNLIKVMYDDSDELKNIIVTRDHPIYLADGSMASYRPQRTKDLYDLDASQLEIGNSIQMIDGTKEIHRFEYMADKDTTYTILTKNNNFYAGGVLVHSEIGA